MESSYNANHLLIYKVQAGLFTLFYHLELAYRFKLTLLPYNKNGPGPNRPGPFRFYPRDPV